MCYTWTHSLLTFSYTPSSLHCTAALIELLEEDDEFQEFDSASWEDAKVAETEDNQLWKDDWDDDDAVDDFTEQLRAQIQQASK
jgi:broad specificity phosphatase PhoE